MDLANFIVMVVGIAGLYWYQYYRIKQLTDKTKDQNDILKNIETYLRVIDPKKMKAIMEAYDQLTEKHKEVTEKDLRLRFVVKNPVEMAPFSGRDHVISGTYPG